MEEILQLIDKTRNLPSDHEPDIDDLWDTLNRIQKIAQGELDNPLPPWRREGKRLEEKRSDWVVTTYNEFEKRISRFKLENRTEREASTEAEASVEVREAHNWTLTTMKRTLIVTEREKELLRMAVIYSIPNLDDVIESFADDLDEVLGGSAEISVDGCPMEPPTEEEMSSLLKHF